MATWLRTALVEAAVLVGVVAEQHPRLAGAGRVVHPGVVLEGARAGRLVAAQVAVLEVAVAVVVVAHRRLGPGAVGVGAGADGAHAEQLEGGRHVDVAHRGAPGAALLTEDAGVDVDVVGRASRGR